MRRPVFVLDAQNELYCSESFEYNHHIPTLTMATFIIDSSPNIGFVNVGQTFEIRVTYSWSGMTPGPHSLIIAIDLPSYFEVLGGGSPIPGGASYDLPPFITTGGGPFSSGKNEKGNGTQTFTVRYKGTSVSGPLQCGPAKIKEKGPSQWTIEKQIKYISKPLLNHWHFATDIANLAGPNNDIIFQARILNSSPTNGIDEAALINPTLTYSFPPQSSTSPKVEITNVVGLPPGWSLGGQLLSNSIVIKGPASHSYGNNPPTPILVHARVTNIALGTLLTGIATLSYGISGAGSQQKTSQVAVRFQAVKH